MVEKRQDDKKGEEDAHEGQKEIQEDSNSFNREMEEKDINIEPLETNQENVTLDIEHCKSSGIGEALQEKKGIKRKRGDDDDDYEMNNRSSHETQGKRSFWPLYLYNNLLAPSS